MKIDNLKTMNSGWFIGNFLPNVVREENFEIAVKSYKAGDKEDWHVHKIAYEITVILNGIARMNGREFYHGDIIKLEPGEGTDFEAISDLQTVVVKSPSVIGDKYFVSSSS